jgi:anti-sigma28 factor (negative regulator of flagellin synthesis)
MACRIGGTHGVRVRTGPGHEDREEQKELWRVNTTSLEEVLQKVAPLADVRRHKVLDIRRRIAEGTYEVAGRLDGVVSARHKS